MNQKVTPRVIEVLRFFLGITMLLSFAACGGKKNNKESIKPPRSSGAKDSGKPDKKDEPQEELSKEELEKQKAAADAKAQLEALNKKAKDDPAAEGEGSAGDEDVPDLQVEKETSTKVGEVTVTYHGGGGSAGLPTTGEATGTPEYVPPYKRTGPTTGLPGGQPSDIDPIVTGATIVGRDGKERLFTDGKNDVVMARLIHLMNEQASLQGEDFFENSKALAGQLSNVNVQVDSRESGNARVEVEFLDDTQSTVKVRFEGRLDYTMQASLSQITQPEDKGYRFYAYVTCVDEDQRACRNTVLVLEQLRDGEICKRLFIVHRFGDAKIIISDNDYVSFPAFRNDGQREFMQYLANTVHYNRYVLECVAKTRQAMRAEQGDGTCLDVESETNWGSQGRLPRARVIGYRTWSAAYGASFFNLFTKEVPRGRDPIDVMHVYGPLLVADQGGVSYDRSLQVTGMLSTENNVGLPGTGQSLADSVSSAYLLSNNGKGHLTLSFNFYPDNAVSYIEVEDRLGRTLDPYGFVLYAGQPKVEIKKGPEGAPVASVEGAPLDTEADVQADTVEEVVSHEGSDRQATEN